MVQSTSANLYLPFFVGNLPFTSRVNMNLQQFKANEELSYGLDLSSFIGRFRLRTKFRDQLILDSGQQFGEDGEITLSAMYTIPRTPNIRKFLRGTYFRTELKHDFNIQSIRESEIQILKQIGKAGRIQITYTRDYLTANNMIILGLSWDFNSARSSTTLRSSSGTTSLTQTFRGSLAIDGKNKAIVTDNMQQVGRSGITVRMYVDENSSGEYDQGEQIIPGNAIRIKNSSSRQITKNGVSRLTQLLPYRKYNFVVNEAYIRDPLLVPKYKEFSVVTDPNRYKQIDVPFNITGVISGQVLIKKTGGNLEPVGGLRLYLQGIESDLNVTMHTFADGSFYAMEIPPGEYQLEIDETQLQFLQVQSSPKIHYFRVEAKPEGDFIENLDYILGD